MEKFREDPKKVEVAKALFGKEPFKKKLIIEVVESHGCTVGLEPGDKLVFDGLGALNTERSDTWCAHAMSAIPGVASVAQDRLVSGLDPGDMIYEHFSCQDARSEHGFGQVIMKAYVEEE